MWKKPKLKKLRIFVVSNSCWNLVNYRYPLLSTLHENGYEVYCIAPLDDSAHTLASLGVTLLPVKLKRSGLTLLQDIIYIKQMGRLIRTFCPNVVLTFTAKPNIYIPLIACQMQVPSIVSITGFGSAFLKQGILRWLFINLYKVSLPRSTKVFFHNKSDRDFCIQNGFLRYDRTVVVPGSGINLKCCVRSLTSPGIGEFRFLMHSRLLKDKGVLEYIAACKVVKQNCPSIHCELAGFFDAGNPSRLGVKQIEQLCNEAGVQFKGRSSDAQKLYNGVSCVVLPSYREGLPRVLLEAACAGIPSITTDVPGCRDVVIDGETGLLCRVADAHDLARKMLIMSEFSRDALNQMGRLARERVAREFNEETVTKAYIDEIERCVSDSR